ncbi:hypothetical protein J6590_013973 [Homalodisca vitripennis]|nr:hypothetical protein J6590_013973 [Homalodisca vitripennis]
MSDKAVKRQFVSSQKCFCFIMYSESRALRDFCTIVSDKALGQAPTDLCVSKPRKLASRGRTLGVLRASVSELTSKQIIIYCSVRLPAQQWEKSGKVNVIGNEKTAEIEEAFYSHSNELNPFYSTMQDLQL